MVRVPSHDQHAIEHALDIGADGMMVPKVSTSAEAEAVAAATRFPPAGLKGVKTPIRPLNWGFPAGCEATGSGRRGTR
ncbi:aldolase/citrate lyase family protein [Kitasatospora sp. NPDC059648]|uniref:aldolase/citrate lyase family protein n=1 Tax=Kitasatospora sp. NPDC059648 TaxID=3346894 RepID=UPI003693BB42